jgi:hypothetical protein
MKALHEINPTFESEQIVQAAEQMITLHRQNAALKKLRVDLLDTIADLLRKSGQRRRACSHIDGRQIEYLYNEALTCAGCEWRCSFMSPGVMIEWRAYCPDCGGKL